MSSDGELVLNETHGILHHARFHVQRRAVMSKGELPLWFEGLPEPVPKRNYMWPLIAALCVLVIGLLILSSGAKAQMSCSTRDSIVKGLAEKYEESSSQIGLAANGSVVEVFKTEDGGTWTIVVTAPNGRSCIVAAGRYWKDSVQQAKQGQDPAA
jgi:hypothetical protein